MFTYSDQLCQCYDKYWSIRSITIRRIINGILFSTRTSIEIRNDFRFFVFCVDRSAEYAVNSRSDRRDVETYHQESRHHRVGLFGGHWLWRLRETNWLLVLRQHFCLQRFVRKSFFFILFFFKKTKQRCCLWWCYVDDHHDCDTGADRGDRGNACDRAAHSCCTGHFCCCENSSKGVALHWPESKVVGIDRSTLGATTSTNNLRWRWFVLLSRFVCLCFLKKENQKSLFLPPIFSFFFFCNNDSYDNDNYNEACGSDWY